MAKQPAPLGFGRPRPMPDEAGAMPPTPPVGETDEQDAGSDPNFEALMEEVGRRFEPAHSLEQAGLQLTTQQVFERLQAFYPSTFYSVRLVYDALQKLGFTYDDPFKDMNFVWLFK